MTTPLPAVQISAEITPNPNTLKFVVNRQLATAGSMDFPDREKAKESPLAFRLFQLSDKVNGVFIGSNFITVTKTADADWNAMVTPVVNAIRSSLDEGLEVAKPLTVENSARQNMQEYNDPVSIKVREILDREIRPAVAMDGGDITFIGYADGIVTLHLRGSCSSCPSSIMTLKMGVENRLKAEIPEVQEVVQV